MIFLRDFYDKDRRVNTGHKWVWGVHAICYTYVAWIYFFTNAVAEEKSEYSKMWIPLDMILTINIAFY